MSINELQDEVIEEFDAIGDDWMDRYQMLIDMGEAQEPLPAEVLDAELYFIDRIGLRDHLSPTRSNGLLAMVRQIRMYALAFQH